MFRVAALLVAVATAGVAHAETRRFYDAAGRLQGRAESQGNVTRFYDQDGRPASRSEVGPNGVVRHYDQEGRPQGETRR